MDKSCRLPISCTDLPGCNLVFDHFRCINRALNVRGTNSTLCTRTSQCASIASAVESQIGVDEHYISKQRSAYHLLSVHIGYKLLISIMGEVNVNLIELENKQITGFNTTLLHVFL